MSINIETLEPGDRVAVEAAEYAFGPSFLAGPGTVLQNRDVMSREREEIVIRFDRGVTGIFKAAVLKELLDQELTARDRAGKFVAEVLAAPRTRYAVGLTDEALAELDRL